MWSWIKGYAPVIAGIWGRKRGGGVDRGLSKLKKLAGYQFLWAKTENENENEKKGKRKKGGPKPHNTVPFQLIQPTCDFFMSLKNLRNSEKLRKFYFQGQKKWVTHYS